MNLNTILEENNISCVKVIFMFQRHKPKLRLLKLTMLLIIKTYQSGKVIPAKTNKDELL